MSQQKPGEPNSKVSIVNEKKGEPNMMRSILGEIASAALGGTIHSLIETPIVIPIEAAITQTQINGRNFFWNFGQLFKGRNLYRSLPTALLGAAPKAVIHYSWLTLYMNFFVPTGTMRDATLIQSIQVGLCTGASEVVFATPINFCKFRMQRPEWGYKGLLDAIRTVAREEGISAFWKGTLPTFYRNSICMAGMLGGNKLVEPMLPDYVYRRHLISGMAGGVIGSLASYPFEMWRAARMHNRNFYEDMWSHGPKRMLAGWAPGATRLVITSGIMGELLPKLKNWAKVAKGVSTTESKPEQKKSGH